MCEAATTQRFLRPRTATSSLPESRSCLVGEQIVHGRHFGLRVDAQVQRSVRLRIDIDQPHALPGAGERGAQIHRGRRFADAALLIDDGDAAHGLRTGG